MRLVRLAAQPAKVADDIRAALTSLGRGSSVVGGVALIGVQPPDCPLVDAVVVLPKGVLIIVGVDLPDPAMRLEAPLAGQWKADGWPLIGSDQSVNPATTALDASAHVVGVVRRTVRTAIPVGTVLAIGPYVEEVEQSGAEGGRWIQVRYPSAPSLRTAALELTEGVSRCSVHLGRKLVAALAPDAPEFDDATLIAEGFRPTTEADLAADIPEPEPPAPTPIEPDDTVVAASAPEPRKTTPSPRPRPKPATSEAGSVATAEPIDPAPVSVRPAPAAEPSADHPQGAEVAAAESAGFSGTLPDGVHRFASAVRGLPRWVPLAAIAVLVIAIVAIVAGTGGSDEPAAQPVPAPQANVPAPGAGASTQPVPTGPVSFIRKAAGGDRGCASHAYGDAQASLQRTSCGGVRRASLLATIGDRQAAVTTAEVTFPESQASAAFKQTVDTPGGGGILDLATETGGWAGPAPTFAGAAFASTATETTVRLAQVVWLSGPSKPDDPALVNIANEALQQPLSD